MEDYQEQEWNTFSIGQFVDFSRGVSWNKSEANQKGEGIPVISIPNIKPNGIISYENMYFLTKRVPDSKYIENGDIIFVGSSGSLKNICRNLQVSDNLSNNKFTFASFTFRGRSKDTSILDPKFLFYLMNSNIMDYNKYARRAADGKFNFQLNEFKSVQQIPLPPISEQRKIAYVLSTIQAARSKTGKVIATLKELKKSLMQHLFTYGPVPISEIDKVELKETEIGLIPAHFDVKTLSQLLIKRNEIEKKPSNSHIYIGLEHIESGNVCIKKHGLGSEVVSSKTKFEVGNILYGKLRTYLDKCAIAHVKGICSTDILVFDTHQNVNNKFMGYQMHTNEFIKYANSTMTGVNHPRTSWDSLKKYYIGLPCYAEQKVIASILELLDNKISNEDKKLNALNEVFNSMLENLMTAKLRVNQLEV